MDMFETISTQHSQLTFEPDIVHANRLQGYNKFIVSGMGGSHLAADIVKCWNPLLDIIIHSDYGIPALNDDNIKDRLFIASSYSGNTEEVLDGFNEAQKKHIPTAVIAVGGILLTKAKELNIPSIQMPNTGIQPRASLGFSLQALVKIIRQDKAAAELRTLATTLLPSRFDEAGRKLSERIAGRVPIIYSSARNKAIAYNWKIKCNETGKIPAFMNVIPEMNHNEMTGFDAIESTVALSARFYGIILCDDEDDPRVQKRMDILKHLYEKHAIPTEIIHIEGKSRFEKIFSLLYLADWTAYYTAMHYGADPNNVPMVEEFKQLIAG